MSAVMPESAAAQAAVAAPRASALACALDGAGVLVLHIALDGRLIGWNHAARSALGYRDAPTSIVAIDPTLEPGALAALVSRAQAGRPVDWSADWRRADGGVLAVHAALALEEHAGRRLLVCCATRTAHVPPPVRADAPETARPGYRGLFEDLPSPMCVQGADLRLLDVNRAYCDMLGYTRDELLGRDPLSLAAPEDREAMVAARGGSGTLEHLLRQGRVHVAERRFLRRDGRLLMLRVRTWIVDDPGLGTCAFTVSEDLTHERQQVDQLIRDRELFRLLFEDSPSAISIQDPSFRLLKVNRAYCALLGYEANEIEGHDPIEFMDTATREAVLEQRARLSRGEHVASTLTRRIRRKDGSVRACRLMRRTILSTAGERLEVITLLDETDEIRMQQRLRAYLQRFERFFEQAPVGLMICDVDDRVVLANRALSEIVGRSREQLIGATDALRGPMTPDRAGHGHQRLVWNRDDGSTRWIDRVERRLEDLDGRPVLLTVIHDVTRERMLRDELMETEERFRQFAELIDDALFVADADLSRIQYANKAFGSLWGLAPGELRQRPRCLLDPLLPEHREPLLALFVQPASGHAHERVVRLRHPQNGVRSVRVRVYAEADQGVDGRAPQRFAVAEDVTDHLRLEQARLENALEQRDMLIREVHHRIKNNLQGVAGLLQQSASSRPELSEALYEVVGRIQAIAQIHGLQVREGEALVVERVVRAVFENLARTFGVDFPIVVSDPAAVEVWRVPEQEAVPLALVVNELGTNAIKHRLAGGRLAAQLGPREDGLVIDVCNTGALAEGFDFGHVGPSPSGLGLVKALLPRRGASVEFSQVDERVVARLELAVPALKGNS
jgi:PAS domain S-box-containing protein